MKEKYFTLNEIKKRDCRYNVIFGERSNGKTYACLQEIIDKYFTFGEKGAVIRRWAEDFKNNGGSELFNAFVDNNYIKKISKNKFDSIKYYARKWFFINTDTKSVEPEPFCYGFALTESEHKKGPNYGKVTTILFDEFITRKFYLPDEFTDFMNVLSTIIRDRDNVKIYMCGNTVNKYCPYFSEMGLTRVTEMKKGQIDVYTYGDSGLRVAVQYSDSPAKSKKSDIYFAFNNPRLNMIKNGDWEFNNYPHLPKKYLPKNVLYIYYIVFDKNILQCNIIAVDDNVFTYIHRKTTEINEYNNRLVYKCECDSNPLHRVNIYHYTDKISKKILWFYQNERVFYQDNEVGEIVNNYLKWCRNGG